MKTKYSTRRTEKKVMDSFKIAYKHAVIPPIKHAHKNSSYNTNYARFLSISAHNMAESSKNPLSSSTEVQHLFLKLPEYQPLKSSVEPTFEPIKCLSAIEGVTVRVKGVSNTNNNSAATADRVIAKQSAVCRFCFRRLNDENQNVLKTLCSCDMTLTHTKCAQDWYEVKGCINCERCNQDIKFIPVVILSKPKEKQLAPPATTTKERKSLGGSIKDGEKRDSGYRRGWFGRRF